MTILKNNTGDFNFTSLLIALLFLGFASCVDREFDEPPIIVDTLDFPATGTIAQLKSYYAAGKFVEIPVELDIHAVVVADDRSGNFYKTLIIQDSTGGIELKLNRIGLYSSFPVGMKVGLRCQGLTIGDYNGLIQLGLGTYQDGSFTNIAGIEDVLIENYLFKGPKNQTITPKIKTINTLTAQDISTIVQLERLEFSSGELGKTYADAVGQNSVNLILTDCDKNEIILRSSGFADFANIQIPEGNGPIVGILGKFRTDVQLFIRDTSDIKFYGPTCNTGPANLREISIQALRALYSGATTAAPDSTKIVATVISDKEQSNITSRNVVVQDATGGIVVRFLTSNTFALGDLIEINISTQELSEFQGLLQLNNVDISRAKKTGTNTITPVVKTLAEVLSNFEALESTLVEVRDVQINKASGSNFSGTCILTDATGIMDLFTQSYAAFANSNFPVGNLKLVGFINQGGSSQAKQISIRNLNDITGGSNPTAEYITILALRRSFSGSTSSVPAGKKIKGIVVSDRTLENTTLRNIHIQDSTGGIVVRFTANHSFNLGDELDIDISGQEFTEFQGLLEVNNVPLDKAVKTSTGQIQAKTYTIADVLANFEDLESSLVIIQDVQISKVSGTTYSGSCVITDASGQMELYTRPAALFSNQDFPTVKVRITGIVNQGGALLVKQISIRSPGDVQP
ncbi:MAG: hypothetical protein IPM34_07970 [Saprospiraceae bacterium]|nr:hypothetical protein [Saprospiraceae bacterium]